MSKIIEILSEKINKKSDLIEDFFVRKFEKNPPIFYNSVDLRHSGFKIAPVDTNCFPAGFNNLSSSSKEKAKKIVANFLQTKFPNVKNILILPENHTRNLRYLENLLALQEILQNSQNHVIIGSAIENLEQSLEIELSENKKIILQPLIKKGTEVSTADGFVADLIILNNDLTGGILEILKNLTTPIIPALELGWYRRTKSHHFSIYNKLAEELALILEIDPWLISSMHRSCHNVDFKEQIGFQCLAKYVDDLLEKLQEKYKKYDIKDQPYCYVKADNGTYGMAVMPVFSSSDLIEINKKERNKMNMLKEHTQNKMVMIQEGIKTIDTIENNVAEPMIYMMLGQVVGNLFRVNKERDNLESLNAMGAQFFDLENLSDSQINLGSGENEVTKIYSMIARLAALASTKEF